MNIREAAAELNTTPKSLRRVLRKLQGFGGVGLGGLYDLTPDQLEVLRPHVAPHTEAPMPYPELDQSPGFDPSLLRDMRRGGKLRQQVLAQRAARRERLMTRLADPEVAAFSAAQRAAELEAASRTWLPVKDTPWRAGVDSVTDR